MKHWTWIAWYRLFRLSMSFLVLVHCSLLGSGGIHALAQERLGKPPGRPWPTEPTFPAPSEPTPLPRPVLPPIPPPPPEEQERLPVPQVFVRQINVVGNTVFSPDAIAAVTNAYVNRVVTSEDLEGLRLALTRLYINAGYINSGAILPDQTVSEGVITYQIIEGTLTSVAVDGNRWFRDRYLVHRLALDRTVPLNISAVQERLQALQQDDRIERLDAELRPGVQLGESALQVRVVERLPFYVALEFNNHQSPTVGAERGLVTVAHRNLTGRGDVLSATYGRSEGLDLQIDTSYTLPLNALDTTLSLRYRRNDSAVVEDRFAPLDIASQSEIYTLTLRHPVYRTLRRELAVALSAEQLESQTSLGDEPFPFSLGSDNGETKDTAVRLSAEWLDRTPNQVIAIRSRFSLGIDLLDPTLHGEADVPDGQFFAWLGQFQWGRRLGLWDTQLLFRLDLQFTTEPLLPLEQIAVGGRFSVRGYRENTLVRDNGVIASLEARFPVVQNKRWAELIQLVPFVDFGRGWNQKIATPDPTTLVSVGLGMRWSAAFQVGVPLRAQWEVFWGYRIKDVETEGGDLQDHGLHLQFVVSAF